MRVAKARLRSAVPAPPPSFEIAESLTVDPAVKKRPGKIQEIARFPDQIDLVHGQKGRAGVGPQAFGDHSDILSSLAVSRFGLTVGDQNLGLGVDKMHNGVARPTRPRGSWPGRGGGER